MGRLYGRILKIRIEWNLSDSGAVFARKAMLGQGLYFTSQQIIEKRHAYTIVRKRTILFP